VSGELSAMSFKQKGVKNLDQLVLDGIISVELQKFRKGEIRK
jgi:hypothetical protein